jgi:hypothetical protein
MARGKKGSGGYLIVFVLILIVGIFIGMPAIPEKIKTVISALWNKPLPSRPVLGTEDNPFDWSTMAKQIASAPSLPEEGSAVYIRPASGYIRLVKKGEISWAKNEYMKQAKPSMVVSNPRPLNTVKSKTNSTPRTTGVSNQRQESSSQKYTPNIPEPPVIMYYGANIGQFPPRVRNWIANEAFSKSKMEDKFSINPQLKAWWSDDKNAVMFEASYTVASGYIGAGTRATWGTGAHYSGGNLQPYGQYAKYKTLKFEYDLKREVEYLIANDPVYAEAINFAKRLCRELEYDWTNFSNYHGARPVRTPGMRYVVCDGYADEVMNKASSLNGVKSVEKWTGPGHAWNVINLIDGRVLYFDLTWFDNEHINEKTGRIYQTDDYDWENITFNEDLFRFSNIGYGTKTFSHNQGKFERIIRKSN